MTRASATRGLALVSATMLSAMLGCGLDQADLRLRVLDGRTNVAVAGAHVLVDGHRDARTNGAGFASLPLTPGIHRLAVSHRDYATLEDEVRLQPRETAVRVVRLAPRPAETPLPSPAPNPSASPVPGASPTPTPHPTPSAEARAELFGRVTDDAGNRLTNVLIFVESPFGLPLGSATTNAHGEYRVGDLPSGRDVRATAILENRRSVSRTVKPVGAWRLDFTGAYGLKPPATPEPGSPAQARVAGLVKDTRGRTLDGAVVRVEASNVRYPFNGTAVTRNGRYELSVPTGLRLRFSAQKEHHRPMSFHLKVEDAQAQVDFTGPRALEPLGSSGQPGE